MQTAALIDQGDVQSVRLPEGLRIEGKEVFVKRIGRSLLLIPTNVDRWEMMRASLDQFTDDFMKERRQPDSQRREDAFERDSCLTPTFAYL